jgi:hypothetical protein
MYLNPEILLNDSDQRDVYFAAVATTREYAQLVADGLRANDERYRLVSRDVRVLGARIRLWIVIAFRPTDEENV